MELIELYNNIENPIDDSKVIKKLIKVYEDSFNEKDFYHNLVDIDWCYNSAHNKKDKDEFYAMIFNKWKNNVLSMTKEEYDDLYKDGLSHKYFLALQEHLQTVPDFKTYEEVYGFFDINLHRPYEIADIQRIINSYKALHEDSYWTRVFASSVTVGKESSPDIEHRIYLNVESSEVYKMATILVEKCEKYHIPYIFKFSQKRYDAREDGFVIYSSTEHITKYVEILNEIKKENPELVSKLKEPPIVTGKIDKWIGYGSEPSVTPDGEPRSFHQVRVSAIQSAISKATKEWIMKHRNNEVTYKNQKLSLQNYIAIKATEMFIPDLKKLFIEKRNDEEKRNKKLKGELAPVPAIEKIYNETIITKQLGYSLQEISSAKVRMNIYKAISSKMDTLLPQFCNGEYENMELIPINIREERPIAFSSENFKKLEKLPELVAMITENDPSFISLVQEQIKNNSKEYGIDENKFCFDTLIKRKMERTADKKERTKKVIGVSNEKTLEADRNQSIGSGTSR